MAITSVTSGTIAYGITNVVVSYPTGVVATDLVVMIVAQKPSVANSGGCTTPTNWTLLGDATGGGYGSTLGADTGNTYVFVYYRVATGSLTGSETLSFTNPDTQWAKMFRYTTDTGSGSSWGLAYATGADTTGGNASVSFTVNSANLSTNSGERQLIAFVTPTDVAAGAQFSSHAITYTGVTYGSITEDQEPNSGNGNDIGGVIVRAQATAGTSTGANPTWTATASGTTTNVRGPGIYVNIDDASAIVFQQSPTMSGVGVSAVIKQVNKPITFTGTAANNILRRVGLIKSVSGFGTSTLSQLYTWAKSLAYSAIGSATFSRLAVKLLSLAMSATGVSSILKKINTSKTIAAIGTVTLIVLRTVLVSLAYTATGVNSLVKRINKVLTSSALGTANVIRSIAKTILSVAVGAASFVKNFKWSLFFTSLASGSASVQKRVNKFATMAASAISSIIKQISTIKANVATGVVTFTKFNIRAVALAFSAIGSVSFQAIKAILRLFAMSAVGASSVVKLLPKVFTSAASGVASRLNRINLSRVYSALGTNAVLKLITKPIGIAATGVSTFSKLAAKLISFAYAAVGSPTFAKATTLLKALVFAALGTSSVLKQVRKTIASVASASSITLTKQVNLIKQIAAVGAANMSKLSVKLLSLAYSALGSANLAFLKVLTKAFAFTAVGTSNSLKLISKTLSNVAVGLTSIVKRVNITRIITATGISVLASKLNRVLSFAINALGTASLTTLKVFTASFVYSAVGTVTILKRIGKLLNSIATGLSVYNIKVVMPKAMSAIGSATFAFAAVATKSFTMFATGVVTFSKIFLGGFVGAAQKVYKRGKLLMNRFGRW